MTYIDCEECDGEGYLEYQLKDESFRVFACKCNKGADEEPDRERDDCETDEK